MKKVLVTGSAGFVGNHLRNILKKEYKILGIDKTTGDDILNADFLNRTISDFLPDFIIHLAALTKTWSIETRELFNVNVLGTLSIYEAVLKTRGGSNYNPKILYISTSEVYGKSDNPENITESSLINPTNPYSSSKAAADRLSYAFSQSKNLNIVILRPFTHTGPGQAPGFFVPDVASQIAQNEIGKETNEIKVGNLETIKDYLDARDVVDSYKKVMEAETVPGEVFNIASGKPVKMKVILKKLLSLSKTKMYVVLDPERLRAVDVPLYVGNCDKLKNMTGWEPKIDLDETLSDTLNYWREKVAS